MEERDLIEAIREAPGDDQRWAVYGDQLQARGDLRGQLIALGLAGKVRAERQLRKKHQTALGAKSMWEALDAGTLHATWRAGHFRRVRFLREHQPELLEAILDSPLALAISALDLQLADDEATVSQACDVLSRRLPPLRSLEVTTGGMAGRLAPGVMLSKLTRLERAGLFGLTTFDELRHARLESLTVWFNDWRGAPACVLEPLEAPRLVELTMGTRFDCRPSITRWVREHCVTPSLRGLTIESPTTSQLVEAIADAPFAAQLERLVLLEIDEASAHILLGRRADMPRLKSVNARFFRTSASTEASVRAAFTA